MQLTEKDWVFLEKLNDFMEISRLDDDYINLFFGKYLKHNYPELNINVVSGYVNMCEYPNSDISTNQYDEYVKNEKEKDLFSSQSHCWLEIQTQNDDVYLLDLNPKLIFSSNKSLKSIRYMNSHLNKMENLLFNPNIDKYIGDNQLDCIEFSSQSDISNQLDNQNLINQVDTYMNMYCDYSSLHDYWKSCLHTHPKEHIMTKKVDNLIDNIENSNNVILLEVHIVDNSEKLFVNQMTNVMNKEYLDEISKMIARPVPMMEDLLDRLDLSEAKKHKFKI